MSDGIQETVEWQTPKSSGEETVDWKAQPGKSVFKRPGQPTFPQQMGGLAYGAGTELIGAPGEAQEFFTTSGKGERLFGAQDPLSLPKFPTAPEIRKGLKGTPLEPAKGTEAMQKTGEVLADVGMMIPAGYRALGKMAGETTAETERLAKIAEKMGFKLSPSQLRADVPVTEKGALFAAKDNQRLANQLASRGTGKQVNEVTPEFISSRINDLGKEFDAVYKGKTLKVDPSIGPQLENILAREQDLGFAGVSTVKQAAQTMLENSRGGYVKGDDYQRLRNALTQAARTSDNRAKSHEIYELVDILDEGIEKKNAGMAAKLAQIRPQYRNTIILEDLYRSDGIRGGNVSLERLGDIVNDKSVLRRVPQDIDTLGEVGRQLGLRARWQPAGEESPAVVQEVMRTHGPLATAIKRTVGAPLRSTTARKAQKAYQRASRPQVLSEALGAVPAIEEVISPSQRK